MENIARKKIELQANSVRISSELKDELFQKYNFPGMHVGWMIFCIENPEEPENPLNAFLSGE